MNKYVMHFHTTCFPDLGVSVYFHRGCVETEATCSCLSLFGLEISVKVFRGSETIPGLKAAPDTRVIDIRVTVDSVAAQIDPQVY